mmetsp:Transcript_52680/g.105579  ORF Transcript_52680/g.105579 Transcript_52680/m.105579 type:complete len:222 (-) Transcript_52680:254-919(-)
MLSMITAVMRLMAVCFSRKPRTKRGTMTASEGESMVCTNTTPPSLFMRSGTCCGFTMHCTRSSSTGAMSLLPATVRHAFMALVAAFFTSFFTSVMHGVSSGMIWGRHTLTSFGLVLTQQATRVNELTRVCHGFSTCMAANTKGATKGKAEARAVPKAATAASACPRTASLFELARSNANGSASTRNGSPTFPTDLASAVTTTSAHEWPCSPVAERITGMLW